MTPATWRLRVNDGVKLHVEAKGRPARGAAPVLLANGITMSTESWNALGRRLEEGRLVVRYDMRGQGASDAPPGPYLRERHARDLLALLADLTGRGLGPLHLVALSNGGYVSQLLLGWSAAPALAAGAGLSPAELEQLPALAGGLRSLTLLDTFATADPRLVAAVRSWLSALDSGGAGARFDAALPWVWGPDFLGANAAALAEARELAAGQPQEAVRGLLEGLLASSRQEPHLDAALGTSDLPLLVALGEDDVLTPARSHRRVLEQFGRDPAEMKLIPRAGHAAPIENASAVAALLVPFLNAHDVSEDALPREVDAM